MTDKSYFRSVDINAHDEPCRTSLHCHACGKDFIALLDYRLDGQHTIECPHCYHRHYRIIQAGKVTDDRHDSDMEANRNHRPLRVWKDSVLPIETSAASEFIRNRWLMGKIV